MSEEKLQQVEGQEPAAPESQGEETLDATINKSTNELKIKDPTTGRIITFKVIDGTDKAVDESKEKREPPKPLAPEAFHDALQKIDALGLTWTADVTPGIRPKTPENEEALLSPEFVELRGSYPNLPREVGSVVFHILTGSKPLETVVGDEDGLQKKAAAVSQFVLNTDFRSEFFFKHAIKVPYLSDVDWEVVFKLAEKNVKGMPAISYALLSLLFHNPNLPGGRPRASETTTVAVNEFLIDKLIASLTEAKGALEASRQLADLWDTARSKSEDGDDDARTEDNPKQLA